MPQRFNTLRCGHVMPRPNVMLRLLTLIVFTHGFACSTMAQDSVATGPIDKAIEQTNISTGQATYVVQSLRPFHSPYAGANSLPSRRETELSQTYTLYIGQHIRSHLEAYVNPELAAGKGIG